MYGRLGQRAFRFFSFLLYPVVLGCPRSGALSAARPKKNGSARVMVGARIDSRQHRYEAIRDHIPMNGGSFRFRESVKAKKETKDASAKKEK